MREFRDYDITLPELVYDVVDYFRLSNNVKRPAEKSVMNYCESSRFSRHNNPSGELIQPDAVHLICENLVTKGLLICTKVGTSLSGIDANYMFSPQNEELFKKKEPALVFHLNCLAYGLRYIYSSYREHVLPVIVKDNEGKIEMGTCFKFHSGILTAKHCVDVNEVYIPGYEAEKLNQCPVYIGKDKDLDLAYIELGEDSKLLSGTAQVLDEVLVMGYPKIPMFFDFCAAERAAISSIPTKGAVASLADQYISRMAGKLMLVTARIRGGNSGGPIIGSDGSVVGVAFSEPMAQGDYDEMGYGIAYPINVFYEMLRDCETLDVHFVDSIQ